MAAPSAGDTCVLIYWFGRRPLCEGWDVPFRFFDHTADVGLELSAPTLPALFEEVEVTVDRGDGRYSLQALVAGEPLDLRRHPGALPVKGITYHRLSVQQTADGWCATVVLDV